MKKRVSAFVILMAAFMLVACSSTAEPSVPTASSTERTGSSTATENESPSAIGAAYNIAVVPQSLNDPYQIAWSNAAKARCEELGYTCTILGAGSGSMADVQGQIDVIENIVTSGQYDGLLYASQSSDGAIVGIEKCLDANLPICDG